MAEQNDDQELAEEAANVEAQKALNDQIIDLIAADEAFRAKLKEDPEAALRDAGLADRVEGVVAGVRFSRDDAGDDDTSGHSLTCHTRTQGCTYFSSRWVCGTHGSKFGPWIPITYNCKRNDLHRNC